MSIVCFLYIQNHTISQEKLRIHDLQTQIEYELLKNSSVSIDWISSCSEKYNSIIYIKDNGVSILPSQLPDENQKLVDKLIVQGRKSGYDFETSPIFYQKKHSHIYSLSSHGKYYFGTISSYTTQSGWQTIFLVTDVTECFYHTLIILFIILFVCLLGTTFFFVFSRHFVQKTLQPVLDAQTQQKNFIAAASHELRSPLAVIKAILPFITIEESEKSKERLNRIHSEIDTMSKLIEDMLNLSSIQSGVWSIQKEEVYPEAFLIELYDMYWIIAERQDVELVFNLPEDSMLPLQFDKERIQQVLMILIHNALSYSLPGSTIELSAEESQERFSVSIADHGIGIADSDKDKVFLPFAQCDKSRTSKKHYGLGLSIAKEIIALHNGSIYITDTEGGGATFTFELPITS